jgi:hypothetical protein
VLIKEEIKKRTTGVLTDIVSQKVHALEYKVKAIHYFLVHELMLTHYRIDINVDDRAVCIHTEPLSMIVEPSVWKALAVKVDLPEFTITHEQDHDRFSTS